MLVVGIHNARAYLHYNTQGNLQPGPEGNKLIVVKTATHDFDGLPGLCPSALYEIELLYNLLYQTTPN